MKKIFCLLMLVIFSTPLLHAQSVAINTDGSTPNASAMVDIKSTSKGMLIPRMTSAQRTAISSPASGLLVFDSSTESFWFYTTSGWTELVSGSSQWTLNGANLTNNNSGSVNVGTGVTTGKFNVNSASAVIADFNGGTNSSYIRFSENLLYRGYMGSFSGAVNDMDFGTGGSNTTGKVHLTLAAVPAVTLDNNGLGIGTTTPSEKLHISSGNILLSNSNLGIRLNAAFRPFVTRGYDAFTSGNYAGIGRWGLFMEPSQLTFGIPAITGKTFEFAKYNVNSTRTTLATVDINGALKRPAQGAVDLLPICIGSINSDGSVLGGTGNFNVTDLTLEYEITITGVTYNPAQYAVIVTPFLGTPSISLGGYPVVYNVGGKIRIQFIDHDGGAALYTSFYFVVYKLF